MIERVVVNPAWTGEVGHGKDAALVWTAQPIHIPMPVIAAPAYANQLDADLIAVWFKEAEDVRVYHQDCCSRSVGVGNCLEGASCKLRDNTGRPSGAVAGPAPPPMAIPTTRREPCRMRTLHLVNKLHQQMKAVQQFDIMRLAPIYPNRIAQLHPSILAVLSLVLGLHFKPTTADDENYKLY